MKKTLFEIQFVENDQDTIFEGTPTWTTLPNGDRVATVKLEDPALFSAIEWKNEQEQGELEIQVDGQNVLSLSTDVALDETDTINKAGKEITLIQRGPGANVSHIKLVGDKGGVDAVVADVTDSTATIRLSSMLPETVQEISVNGQTVATFETKEKSDDPIDPIDPPSPSEKVTFDQFMGTNVLPDDPLDAASAVGHFRAYIYGKWYDADVSNVNANEPLGQIKYAYNPSDAGGWSQDNFYKQYGEAGMLFPTAFESYMRLTNNDKTWLNAVPYKRGERNSLDNPQSWRHISAYYYQLAARYGQTQVERKYIRVQDDNQPLTGMGAIRYIEGENEPDRWWIGKDKADLNGREIAAYMSAIYDGHMGQIVDPDGDPNVKFGARTADPKIKVVMPGIAYVDYGLLEDMIKWFEENRTDPNYETYPFEVLNVHDYANTERKQRNLSGKGMSPESYGWREFHERLINWLKNRVTTKTFEVWNTEFGYDTNQGSPQRCEPYGPYNAEQVQGIWLVRSWLEMCAAGIDRASQFYLRDNDGNSGNIFGSCGLTVKSDGYRRKVSWYHTYTLKNVLTGFKYVRDVRRDEIAHVYELYNDSTKEYCYAAWSPTQNNNIANISFQVNSSSDLGDLIEILDNNTNGKKTPIGVSGGSVQLTVGEKVKFVKVK